MPAAQLAGIVVIIAVDTLLTVEVVVAVITRTEFVTVRAVVPLAGVVVPQLAGSVVIVKLCRLLTVEVAMVVITRVGTVMVTVLVPLARMQVAGVVETTDVD